MENNNTNETGGKLSTGLYVGLLTLFLVSDFFGIIIAFLQVTIIPLVVSPVGAIVIPIAAAVLSVANFFGLGEGATDAVVYSALVLVIVQMFLAVATVTIFIISSVARGNKSISKLAYVMAIFIGILESFPVLCGFPFWSGLIIYINRKKLPIKKTSLKS